jgi:hypothetical protein
MKGKVLGIALLVAFTVSMGLFAEPKSERIKKEAARKELQLNQQLAVTKAKLAKAERDLAEANRKAAAAAQQAADAAAARQQATILQQDCFAIRGEISSLEAEAAYCRTIINSPTAD